jgi:two-component system NtrC family response regulator
VGGREGIRVDASVLSATNTDLDQALKAGRFREDLYYRLGIVVSFMPPLRERGGDILLLAKVLLQRYSAENNQRMRMFTPRALRAIERHSWPVNTQELKKTHQTRGNYG